MMTRKNLAFVVALIALTGCPQEVGGPFAGTGTSSDTGGGDETHGFTPDPVACVPDTCSVPADCCEGYQPNLPLIACPSNAFPNNWACVSGTCVNAGCSTDAECEVPDFVCLQVGGLGACVPVCDDDSDCTDLNDSDADDLAHAMPATTCSGTADDNTNYCLQPLP